jgi:hypothetical protein
MKTVKKLSGLEIDEVSLVDRPANQHGLVVFTKRAEDDMTYFDAEGNPVAEDDLNPGDVVYTSNDADAQELVMLSEEMAAQLEREGLDPEELTVDDILSIFQTDEAASQDRETEREPERELASVGKSAGPFSTRRQSRGRKGAAVTGGTSLVTHVGRRGGASKSLGAEVLEELSKALTDSDRDKVIAKAADRISKAERDAQRAISKAQALEAQAELNEFTEIAKSYELPVDPTELGEILQAVSKVLDPDQLDLLDRVLTTAGAAVNTDELGVAGYAPSYAMDEVSARAQELVGKNDLTPEQATVALFESNPEAYDQYLYETR